MRLEASRVDASSRIDRNKEIDFDGVGGTVKFVQETY